MQVRWRVLFGMSTKKSMAIFASLIHLDAYLGPFLPRSELFPKKSGPSHNQTIRKRCNLCTLMSSIWRSLPNHCPPTCHLGIRELKILHIYMFTPSWIKIKVLSIAQTSEALKMSSMPVSLQYVGFLLSPTVTFPFGSWNYNPLCNHATGEVPQCLPPMSVLFCHFSEQLGLMLDQYRATSITNASLNGVELALLSYVLARMKRVLGPHEERVGVLVSIASDETLVPRPLKLVMENEACHFTRLRRTVS